MFPTVAETLGEVSSCGRELCWRQLGLEPRKPYLLHVLWSVRILFEQTSYNNYWTLKYVRNSLRIKSCFLQEGRDYLDWQSSWPIRRLASRFRLCCGRYQFVSRGAWWVGSYDVNMTYVTTCKTWLIIAFSTNSFTWPLPRLLYDFTHVTFEPLYKVMKLYLVGNTLFNT